MNTLADRAVSARVLTTCLLLLFWISPATATVSLNEVMASNSGTIADEDGDYEDWIELHNHGASEVNLSGWGLSNDPQRPFRWTLPSQTTLGAGEYLLIWASGKDRPGTGGEGDGTFHTDFRISLTGEHVLLTDSQGVLVDYFPPTLVPNDVSIGRAPGEGDTWFFFDEPTPGGPNNTTTYASVLEPVAFSHQGGFHEADFELTLSHPDPDAIIIYTLDGSTPDIDNLGGTTYQYKNNWPHRPGDAFGEFLENSFQSHTYNGPIPIVDRRDEPDKLAQISSTWHPDPYYLPTSPVYKGTVVQARAYKPGNLPSYSRGNTYFVDPDGNPFDHPIMSLHIQEDLLFGYETGLYTAGADFDTWRENNPNANAGGTEHWQAPYNWQRRGDQWEYPGRLEFFEPDAEEAGINQGMGFRIHGNASRGMRSKSLRLYARSRYDSVNEFQHRIFPWDVPFATNPENDVFKRILVRGPGSGGPFMTDWAVHEMMGELYEGVMRVRNVVQFINGEYWGLTAVRDRFDQHHLANHFHIDPDNAVITWSRGWGDGGTSIDVGESSDIDLYNATRSFIRNQNMADDNLYRQAEDMLSIRSYIDHLIPNIYFGNTHFETAFWRAREPSDDQFADGRWRVHTQDFEYALSTSNYLSTAFNNLDMFRNLLENDRFKNRFINRFADLINTSFTPERIESMVLEEYSKLGPDLDDHYHRWSIDYFLHAYPWEPHDSRHMRDLNDLIGYAYDQPARQRQHIRNRFGISADSEITLNVSDPALGHVRINTVEIHDRTPGVGDVPYPWTGVYFNGIPIELEAIPNDGYRLAGWQVDGPVDFNHVNIRNDIGSGRFEIGLAEEGVRPFTDEEITVTSLPQELAGKIALRTANSETTWLYEGEATPTTEIEWSYTDAIPDRGPSGNPLSGANTTLADGSGEFQPPAGSPSGSDEWVVRSVFGNGGSVLQAFGPSGSGGPANARELKTTIRDLEPGTVYPVAAMFWRDGNPWSLRAGLQYGNDNHENELFDHNHPDVLSAATLNWTTDVMVAEGNRFFHAAFLGNATANENGEIDVFIHDRPTEFQSMRTWYDGVATGSTALLKSGPYLAFEVDHDTTVYVINHPSYEPAWLASEFTPTEMTVETTAGTFEVWGKAVSANELIEIPGHGGEVHDLNYWVVLGEGPDSDWTADSVVSLNLTENVTVTAVFEPIPLAELPIALHVWDFEDAAALLEPSFTLGGGMLSVLPGPTTEAISNTGADFETQHLRVNNPLDSELTFSLPTTGYEEIALEFLTRRSGQGAGIQTLSYTVDGQTWIEFDTYTVFDSAPQFRRFDFTETSGVSDNPAFAARITFERGEGGEAGNNRFDDVVLTGKGLPGTLLPPVVNAEAIPERVILAAAGDPEVHNLEDWFTHPNEAALTFQASSTDESVVGPSLDGALLTLSGARAGGVTVTVQADDGVNPAVTATFYILVYPEPFSLAGGNFAFTSWSSDESAGSFPAHMLFLQSDTDDPGLETDLLFAYHIPEDDAASPENVAFPYAASSRSRINGLGESGISFINTGRGRDVGSALLALDTTGVSEIDLSWVAGTVTPNSRVYASRLQYRIGSTAEWADLPGMGPIEYVRDEVAGHEVVFGPVRLPEELEDQPELQLQWRYYHQSVTSGPRAEIRLDDVRVVSGAYPAESFAQWLSRKYPDLSPEEADPHQDPHGEGLPLLLRYALDRDDNPTGDVQVPIFETDGETPALRFRRDPAKSDIAYVVEASTDLEDWNSVLYDSRIHLDQNTDGEWMRIADSVPFSEADARRFLRLRIVKID